MTAGINNGGPGRIRRLLRAAVNVVGMALLGAGGVAAQDYPSKPIRMIVPYAPGGSTDILGRHFAKRLSELLKQQVYVENRGGAGALIGIRAVAQAPADGYTILYTTSIIAINPFIYKTPGYKLDDFVTLGSGGQFPYVLLANEKVPARNLKELVAYARANSGKLNYVSLGKGSPTQLFMARFMAAADISAVEINYPGAAPANQALAGGQVQLQFTGATLSNMQLPHIVPIAITAEERLDIAPNVETFKEAGYPTMLGGTWFALFAPARTPPAIVQKLRTALATAAVDLKDRLAATGTYLFRGRPEEFSAYIKRDTELWEADIKRLNLQMED
jgi:tripartite-type tricarboxylate transporter receptor subunit TctC